MKKRIKNVKNGRMNVIRVVISTVRSPPFSIVISMLYCVISLLSYQQRDNTLCDAQIVLLILFVVCGLSIFSMYV